MHTPFQPVHATHPPRHHPAPLADNSDDQKRGQARGRGVCDAGRVGGRTSDAPHNDQVKTSARALNELRGSKAGCKTVFAIDSSSVRSKEGTFASRSCRYSIKKNGFISSEFVSSGEKRLILGTSSLKTTLNNILLYGRNKPGARCAMMFSFLSKQTRRVDSRYRASQSCCMFCPPLLINV